MAITGLISSGWRGSPAASRDGFMFMAENVRREERNWEKSATSRERGPRGGKVSKRWRVKKIFRTLWAVLGQMSMSIEVEWGFQEAKAQTSLFPCWWDGRRRSRPGLNAADFCEEGEEKRMRVIAPYVRWCKPYIKPTQDRLAKIGCRATATQVWELLQTMEDHLWLPLSGCGRFHLIFLFSMLQNICIFFLGRKCNNLLNCLIWPYSYWHSLNWYTAAYRYARMPNCAGIYFIR